LDALERNIALALVLGRLEGALAVIQGLEYKVFGITEQDLQELEPELNRVTSALASAIQTVVRMVPEGEKVVRRWK
jgi:indole-3-glycerol phosphate synthase